MSVRRSAELALMLAVVVSAGLASAKEPEPKARDASTPAPAPAPGPAEGRGLTANVPCSACHTTEAWRAKGGADREEASGFDHAKTGFPLTGQHLHASCVSCHDGKRAIKRACNTCHDDAHRGRLSQTCDQCHIPAGWRSTKALEIHRFTRLPLTGMHVLADCTECHRRASEHQWTGAPTECFTCHEKDYRRRDLRPVHVGTPTTPPFPRDCSFCHRALGWAPARFDSNLLRLGTSAVALKAAPPQHDLRFPISFGVHRGATCEDCHAQTAVPRLVQCTGCHAHEPIRLAAQHKQSVSTQGSACLSCHPVGVRR